MELSFNKIKKNKIYHLKFENYFKYIGIPFAKIISKMGIKKNINKLKKDYFNYSLGFRKKIKPYKSVYETLKDLQKRYDLAVVTSKSKKNVKNFLNFFFQIFILK